MENDKEKNKKTAKEIAIDLKTKGMKCNCDLDNWAPENFTGHSCVCRIHKEAINLFKQQN